MLHQPECDTMGRYEMVLGQKEKRLLMTDDRTTELREKLTERGARYEKSEDDTTIYYDGDGNRYTYNVNPDSGWAQLFGYNLTPEQAIAATLGGNENRISERLRGIAADMRNIGASSMTPRELFAYWAGEVDKAADLADFMCGVNPDGLPYGLTLSDDGNLLNWRGENYVRQSALGGGKLTAEQVRESIESRFEFDVWVPKERWQVIADELNAGLGGTCEMVTRRDAV